MDSTFETSQNAIYKGLGPFVISESDMTRLYDSLPQGSRAKPVMTWVYVERVTPTVGGVFTIH